ncbi:MAG: L,D-transpeptidase family protein [Pseudomonadota bacterium]
MMRTSVYAFLAVAFAAAILSPAEAKPLGYVEPQQGFAAAAYSAAPPNYVAQAQGMAPASTQVAYNTSPRASGVRLNLPFAQWSNDVAPQAGIQRRAVRTPDGRAWYVPAPRGEVRQYASYGTQPNEYYEPQQGYQQAPSYYQPDPSEPAWRAQQRQQSGGRMDPRFERTVVNYTGREGAGTIVIDTNQRFLFLVQNDGTAIRYGIGVGRPGFEWAGVKSVTRKAEWPDWTPPDEMLKRRPDLPRFMPGGPGNPLGARAMYLGSSLYRIHGTNEPDTIGKAVSSGCIRMVNDDVIDLYQRVRVGTRVIVI